MKGESEVEIKIKKLAEKILPPEGKSFEHARYDKVIGELLKKYDKCDRDLLKDIAIDMAYFAEAVVVAFRIHLIYSMLREILRANETGLTLSEIPWRVFFDNVVKSSRELTEIEKEFINIFNECRLSQQKIGRIMGRSSATVNSVIKELKRKESLIELPNE